MSYICPAPDKNDEDEAELLTDLDLLANSSATQVLKKTGGFVVNYTLLDADTSLTANSDLITPTQKAIKAYVDSQVAGENIFDRVGTVLSPHTAGDSISGISNITLTAGTTTVAPINVVAGTNLTVPVAGAFEFDGTNLYFTV